MLIELAALAVVTDTLTLFAVALLPVALLAPVIIIANDHTNY